MKVQGNNFSQQLTERISELLNQTHPRGFAVSLIADGKSNLVICKLPQTLSVEEMQFIHYAVDRFLCELVPRVSGESYDDGPVRRFEEDDDGNLVETGGG